MNNQYCVNCEGRIVSGKNFHTDWARLLKWVSTKLNGVDDAWGGCATSRLGAGGGGGVFQGCVWYNITRETYKLTILWHKI